ncbi:MAG TPA: 2-hydroxyacid dehydrogenase [Pirellulaceae bacterium]|nr:2-hydroxyacid dehydrogenase [Pirellulaceae bacterium]
MRIAVFSTKQYDRQFLAPAAETAGHAVRFFEPRLNIETCPLANEFPVVCAFVNDELHSGVLEHLARGGTKLIALRCAGFNNADLTTAARLGIQVARVPAYSPYAVAEHAVGLMLSLNRKLHRAYNRVRDGNFSIDGLLGFDMHGKTVGIIGTGKIGAIVAKLLHGFGCRLLFNDVYENPACAAMGKYVSQAELLTTADIISLHCPLMPETFHLINDDTIAQMKPGVMLINTSRGPLVETQPLIRGLKSGRIGYIGLDVYEEEADLFFEDLSNRVIQDDAFTRLLTFPNVLITSHQAFFTQNALEEIARVTMLNVTQFEHGEPLTNAVTAQLVKK